MDHEPPKRIVYDLQSISIQLFKRFAEASELYLFGSRRHRTRSERSDIDLILKHEGFIKPSKVREFIDDTCPALDIFLVENHRAVSVVNESFVDGTEFASLVDILQAVKVWDRETGKQDVDVDWEMIVRADIVFTKTVFPGILLRREDQFLDLDLVKNTRVYIEKLALEINKSYDAGVMDGCAVLCRRLAEILIIELYEAKGMSAKIKKDGNYQMMEALTNITINETAFDVGRNTKTALPKIKQVGDRSAHGRGFTASHADLEPLRNYMRDMVQSLIQMSEIQRMPGAK